MIPHALNGLSFVERLYCHAESDLTSELAKRVKEKPAKGFFVFQSDILLKGDNAVDRMLKDTKGGLWASFTVSAENKINKINECKQALMLAVHKSLEQSTENKKISIRWPDELVYNDKIIGLLRAEYHPSYSDVIILGIDLYLNIFPDQIRSDFETVMTSLLAETGVCQSTGTLLRMIVESFNENTLKPHNELNQRYNEYLYKKGNTVEIDSIRGTLDRVDEFGALCVLADGKLIEIHSGKPRYL